MFRNHMCLHVGEAMITSVVPTMYLVIPLPYMLRYTLRYTLTDILQGKVFKVG